MKDSFSKCPICERTYRVDSMTTALQDLCPACVRLREQNADSGDTEENLRKRKEFFGK